jgi:benzodiazapine receptor
MHIGTEVKKLKLKWWQVALVSLGASLLGHFIGKTARKQKEKLYNKKLVQASWAPPKWVFGPAWAINNYFLISALVRILTHDVPHKGRLMLLQAGIWSIFFSFNYVYFRKKSPILAAAWTMADNVLALLSLLTVIKSDKKTALNYLPLLLWTGFASTVADYQALKNPDPVFRSKALLN